jgi:hypothetical protein
MELAAETDTGKGPGQVKSMHSRHDDADNTIQEQQVSFMKLILATPNSDDVIRLLKAWRFWLVGAIAGALIGAAVYALAMPPFRAQATVNVDFHMEQAWPQNIDREQFYYLDRETRKLEEIAWSDAVLSQVVEKNRGVSVLTLRQEKLRLTQPGVGGWHFYADDADPTMASALASTWAQAFSQAVMTQVALPASPLEKFITAVPAQTDSLPVSRSNSMGDYMLIGALLFLAVTSLGVLFVDRQA